MKKVNYIKIIKTGITFLAFLFFILFLRESLIYKFKPSSKSLKKEKKTLTKKDENKFSKNDVIVTSQVFAGSGTLTLLDIDRGASKAVQGSPDKDMILVGTYSSSKEEDSYAIFTNKNTTKQDFYSIGEELFASWLIEKIANTSVVVMRDNETFTFELPISGDMAKATGNGGTSSTGDLAVNVGKGKWIINKRKLDRSLENMADVLTHARLVPYSKGGKIEGFTVTEIKRKGVFDMIGLKNKDILTSINNYKLDSPEKGIDVLTNLQGEKNLEVEIIRNGKIQKFNYEIR